MIAQRFFLNIFIAAILLSLPAISFGQDVTPPEAKSNDIGIPSATGKTISATPPADNLSIKIGVVNLVSVFNKYNKTKDYETLLEKAKNKEENEIKDVERQINKLNEELEALNKSGDLYREKKILQASLIAQRETKIKFWNEYIKNQVNEQTLKIYKDIREAIETYAKEKGYQFIFKTDPLLSANSEGEDITQQISVRTVLYFPKSADITEEIIKTLNKE